MQLEQILTYLPSLLMPIIYVIVQWIKYKLLDKKEKKMNEGKTKKETSSCCPSAGQSDCCTKCSDCDMQKEFRSLLLLYAQEAWMLRSYVGFTDLKDTPINSRLDKVMTILERFVDTGEIELEVN